MAPTANLGELAEISQDQSHFDLLGLPRRFALDPERIEGNYLARTRQMHPDFHHLGGEEDRRLSLELSARLNEAYRVLRDPFRRAEYCLQLEAGPTAAQSREMSPEFLEEMLDLRMEIQELHENPGDADRLHHMEEQLGSRRRQLLEEIAARFGRIEDLPSTDPRRADLLLQIRQALNANRYLQGLLRDLYDGA